MKLQRYFIAGVLTIVPLWITWLVFRYVLGLLSRIGTPAVRSALAPFQDYLPDVLLAPWFQSLLAVLITLGLLTGLGWVAGRVIGRRVIALLEQVIHRVPVAQQIYGSTKKLLSALQDKPEGVQRVVLIEFPHPGMKTIGLVTRVLSDAASGEKLAAVYVPTTPNPTSGYLEIVPVSALIDTDWTLDEAMSFVISGGAVSRQTIAFSGRPTNGDERPEEQP